MNQKVLNYPIFKHFDSSEIQLLDKSTEKKSVKVGQFILSSLIIIPVLYFLTIYVLPVILTGLTMMLSIVAIAGILFFLFLSWKGIYRGMKVIAKRLDKLIIESNPFIILEQHRDKLYQQKNKFKDAKTKIRSLQVSASNEAHKYEKEVKELQSSILSHKNRVDKLKPQLDSLPKDSDEYSELHVQYLTNLNDAQRKGYLLDQSRLYVDKYGSRGKIMSELLKKLNLAEVQMDIKISDYELTLTMLKRDAEFAKSSKSATEIAKNTIGLTQGWDVEYATELITNTINYDIARTSENLLDIDKLTSSLNVDSDELYSSLEKISQSITNGELVTDASKYDKSTYKLTAEDKRVSGFNIFN